MTDRKLELLKTQVVFKEKPQVVDAQLEQGGAFDTNSKGETLVLLRS